VDGVDTYLPIESITPGTLVKTLLHGYKKAELVGNWQINNTGTDNRLYKCSPNDFPELIKDLYITSYHSILSSTITITQLHKTIEKLGMIYTTDGKYRILACIDERAKLWNSPGIYTIWNLALENEDPTMNYGIYAEGLLVDTCSLNFLRNL
jgi:hypothetical protein